MKYKFGKTIMIHLGGSVMYPDEIDVQFLKKFNVFIRKWVRKGKRFVIVTGGGRLARKYAEAAHQIGKVTDDDKDWLMIYVTRVNADLVRTMFSDIADPVIAIERRAVKKLRYPVTIGAGWHPGKSTDYPVAVLSADFKIGEVIIAGKPDYVYTKDNRKYPNAKPIKALTWKEYRALIPKKWIPGFHSPIDTVSARICETYGVHAIVVYGKDLKNFDNLLAGKEFKGSVIS